jgi:predicted RecA/RadA family phage recombinase
MGQADYVSQDDRITYTNGGNALALGDVVVLNSGIAAAVCDRAIAANAVGSLATRGVFLVNKVTGSGLALGAKVYWDDTNNYVTATTSGNTECGIVVAAAGSGDTTVLVRWKCGT